MGLVSDPKTRMQAFLLYKLALIWDLDVFRVKLRINMQVQGERCNNDMSAFACLLVLSLQFLTKH